MSDKVYEIHGTSDDDPIVVGKLNRDGIGVQFSAGEGTQVTVPWSSITALVRRDRDEDDRPVDEYTGDDVDVEVDGDQVAVEVDDDAESTGRGNREPNKPADPAATKATPPAAGRGKGRSRRAGAEAEQIGKDGPGTADAVKTGDDDGSKLKEFPSADTATVRAWAQENTDLKIADSGPLPDEAYTKYAAAHGS